MLNWLSAPENQLKKLEYLKSIKKNLEKYNFKYIVLLGMGGSSIGPKVFQALLAPDTSTSFFILDSLHPQEIKKLEEKIILDRTLFIVASKSGSTLEPQVLYRYFLSKLENLGVLEPAQHFMAISDPVSPLEQESQEQGFLAGAFGDPLIGGRYSALSAFGLLPALLMNIDVERLLLSAQHMAERCRVDNINNNPGAYLGNFLAHNTQKGRYELVFYFSKSLEPFGAWLEQLIAESLGKHNSGIVPIIDADTELKAAISMSCVIKLEGEEVAHGYKHNSHLPELCLTLKNIYEIGGEMFRWQIAVSIAGALLGLNPFDQPDVEESKKQARVILERLQKGSNSPLQESFTNISLDMPDFLAHAAHKSYAAILSFLDNNKTNESFLKNLSHALSHKLAMPVLVQQGPSYLHSTGQLFKGGINSGCFLVLTSDYELDFAGFKLMSLSQALGDIQAMKDAGRLILPIHLKDTQMGFKEMLALIKH